MRTLFLLRHAKSSWDDPELADHDRPLAPRGRRAAKLIAGHLERERIAPALVLCSSARRTRATLERIERAIAADAPVQIEEGLYAASHAELLERLRRVDDDVESVLLIGHNPGMQELVRMLAGRGAQLDAVRQKFPTGALATLEFAGPWSDLRPGSAQLTGFVRPKELAKSQD